MRKLSLLFLAALLLPAFVRTPAAQAADPYCFQATGMCIDEAFRGYWRDRGGLSVFGYPTTNALTEINRDTGKPYHTQWFERNRLEAHPENRAPYNVLLGRLGDERLRQLGIDWQLLPKAAGPQAGCRWFAETRQNVCDQNNRGQGFKTYWERYGLEFDGKPGTSYAESLALWGLPLTAAQIETNQSGDTVLTQWFERARFEWHPGNPDEYKVLLGLLSNELLAAPGPYGVKGEIAFLRDGDLYVINANGTRQTMLAAARPAEGGAPVWSPTGRLVAYTHDWDVFLARPFDGTARRLTYRQSDGERPDPSWSPNGEQIVFVKGGNLHVAVVADDRRRQLTSTGGTESCPAWSPEGDTIAFTILRNDNEMVATVNASGDNLQIHAAGVCPVWSPSGRVLAFTAGRPHDHNIYLMRADGENLRKLTNTDESIVNVDPQWSPDGKQLLFVRRERGNNEIYIVDVDGSNLINLTKFPGNDQWPAWSPDGRAIAFVRDGTIHLMRADGTGVRALVEGGRPAWSR